MEDFRDPKDWITESIEGSAVLTVQPCFVKHIELTAKLGGHALVRLYNGSHTTAKMLLSISTLASTYSQGNYDIPVYFSQGLHIMIGKYLRLFTIQYKLERG